MHILQGMGKGAGGQRNGCGGRKHSHFFSCLVGKSSPRRLQSGVPGDSCMGSWCSLSLLAADATPECCCSHGSVQRPTKRELAWPASLGTQPAPLTSGPRRGNAHCAPHSSRITQLPPWAAADSRKRLSCSEHLSKAAGRAVMQKLSWEFRLALLNPFSKPGKVQNR